MRKPNAASSVSSPCASKRRRSSWPGTGSRRRSPRGSASLTATHTCHTQIDTAMVEDYLTDREQEEALRNWWRENWRWILARRRARARAARPAGSTGRAYRDQRRRIEAREGLRGLPEGARPRRTSSRPAGCSTDLAERARAVRVHPAGRACCSRKHHAEAGTLRRSDQAAAGRSCDTSTRRGARAGRAPAHGASADPDTASTTKRCSCSTSRRPAPSPRRFAKCAAMRWSRRATTQGARAEYAAALSADAKGADRSRDCRAEAADVGGDVPAAPKAPAAKGDS